MFTRLKNISQFGVITLVASVMLINQATATDAFKGDALYQQQHFEQARTAYLNAAEVGSPHVYYQLGTMHYKGQGIKPDPLSALIWFSLAAEYQFNDSENIVTQIMQHVDDKKKPDVDTLIKDFKQRYGKHHIENKYLPKIITTNLNKKVTFGGQGILEGTQNDATDKLFGVISSSILSDNAFDAFDEFDEFDEFDDEMNSTANSKLPQRSSSPLNFLAILDYDIAQDGSRRNILKVHHRGGWSQIRDTIFFLSKAPLPQPTFDGKRIHFIHRSYLGISKATIDLGMIRSEQRPLYYWIKRQMKKLTKSSRSQDNYTQAMLMLIFPWYPQEDGEAVSLLKSLAEQGHIYSQYEYGLYLYREQIDPAEAIKWLSMASQYGLANAQYRLATILQNSPWVVPDEKKSLFWYETAAKKGHAAALLKSAELKLLANDESLHNQAEAIDILKNIESSQNKNPKYSYLVAVSHLRGEFRDFQKVVKYLRKAIFRGQTLNWDVSKWEEQLRKWTTGLVTIND